MNALIDQLRRGGAAFPLGDFLAWVEKDAALFQQHWRLFGEVLRVYIRRGVINEQSVAKVEIFSPDARRWNKLVSLPIQCLQSQSVTFIDEPLPQQAQDMLVDDCLLLLEEARQILRVTPAPAEVVPCEA